MAIPLSNEMKEVRAPRTAEIMPMDNQKLIEGMGQMALGMNRQMQEGFRGGLKLGQQIMDNQDAFKRNEAERKYNERTTELNTELAQKEGEERVKFQPKYEAEMKLASDTYEAAINKVHNFDIREGSKRSINAWNNRNASNYQYENYKNESELQEKSTAQALIASNRRRLEVVSPAQNLQSLQAMLSDDTDNGFGFKHEEDIIRQFYKGRKGEPDEVVEQRIKDYKSKALIAMANRYNQQTMALDGYTGYQVGTGLLDWGQANNLINAEEAIVAKREMQTERLDACVKMHPNDFISANGRYNIEWARQIAKDLTVDELLKQIGSSSAGRGLGGAAQGILDEFAVQRNRNFYNQFLSDGMGFVAGSVPEKYRNEFINPANADFVAKQQKLRMNDFSSATKAMNYLAQIDSMLKTSRIGIGVNGDVVEVDDAKKGFSEKDLTKKGYQIANLSHQDELLNTRNMLIMHLEQQYHTGALDKMAKGNFFQRWIPGFQKKLTNGETQTLKQMRDVFGNVRPQEIPGWDRGSLNPINMITAPFKAFQRVRKYGWNWELDKRSLPMAMQFDTQMANTQMALSQAAQLTGVSLDDLASDTGNKPVKPQIKQIQLVNGEKKEVIAPDTSAEDITFNQAYSYFLAAQTADTQGDEFMKALTKANIPEAAKVAQFARRNADEDFDTQTQTYTYRTWANRAKDMINPFTGPINQSLKIAGVDKRVDFAPQLPSDQQVAAVAAKIKQFAIKTFTPEEKANPVLQTNNPLGSLAYDMEDGLGPGEPKSYQQLMSDKKAFNEDDALEYITRRDNVFYVNDMITQEKLLEPYNGLRMFYVDDPEMQSVLQNRAMSYSLGVPEDSSTRDVTLDQVANSASEMAIPEDPLAPYTKLEPNQRSQGEIGNKKVVFLTPEGYNYLWSDNFFGEFDLDPSRFHALLGAHNSIIKERASKNSKDAKYIDEPNPLSIKAAPVVPAYLTIPDKDKPFDFR